jgi:DNA replication protein DnaC
MGGWLVKIRCGTGKHLYEHGKHEEETAMDQEIEAAQQKLLEKRKQFKVMVNNTPLMHSSNETWQDIVARIREKAGLTDIPINVSHPHGGGSLIMPKREPDPNEESYVDPRTPEERQKESMHWRGVPFKYGLCEFKNFTGNDKVCEYLKGVSYSNESVVLTGNPGCGKTHLAVAMMQHTGSGKFITIPDLLLKIRDTFNRNDTPSMTEKELIEEYCEVGFLVLDDLGAEKSTEYSITTLYLIINRRINDEKKTVITTNLSMQQISESLGDRVASRLSGMNVVKINMPDYRKKR